MVASSRGSLSPDRGCSDPRSLLIDDRMLALGVAGGAADVLARCRALRRLGARHLSFGPPLGPDPVVAIRLLGEAVLPALNAEEC